tara:strand:+ start:191 stop:526 length:336 start_codon:yes stop_codon:yes gene_type:complete
MIRAIKIMVLALLLPLSACAADVTQKQVVLTQEQVVQKIKSELIMRKGEIVFAAPLKDIYGREIDRSVFYHVRMSDNVGKLWDIKNGVYICTVGVSKNQAYYTDCSITNGQ